MKLKKRVLSMLTAYCLLATAHCLAAITQDDVFKSIKENVSESEGGGRRLMIVLMGGVALVLMLIALSARRKREAAPKALNNPGKLLKEISKEIGLRPAELKQLKALAHASREAGRPVEGPLVLLLCPSALTSAMRLGRAKVDRKVMTGIARKLGLVSNQKR